MDEKTIRDIIKYASVFREAIDVAKVEGYLVDDVVMNRFPRACCGDASCLVGEFLRNSIKGIENDLWYVCGTHYLSSDNEDEDFQSIQSHAWICIRPTKEDEGLIVDITGDQFIRDPEYGYYNETVYVGGLDRFHKLFEVHDGDIRPFGGIGQYDSGTRRRLSNLYNNICRQIMIRSDS